MMKPEDFRQLSVKPGTLIGLFGSDHGPPSWTHSEIITGNLESYIVVERHRTFQDINIGADVPEVVWDAAAIVSLTDMLKTVGMNGDEYCGNVCLLIHRYSEFAWDNRDPCVHVFGVLEGETLGQGPLPRTDWEPITIQLSASAMMTIEEPDAPSEVSIHLHKRLEENRIRRMKESGEL